MRNVYTKVLSISTLVYTVQSFPPLLKIQISYRVVRGVCSDALSSFGTRSGLQPHISSQAGQNTFFTIPSPGQLSNPSVTPPKILWGRGVNCRQSARIPHPAFYILVAWPLFAYFYPWAACTFRSAHLTLNFKLSHPT